MSDLQSYPDWKVTVGEGLSTHRLEDRAPGRPGLFGRSLEAPNQSGVTLKSTTPSLSLPWVSLAQDQTARRAHLLSSAVLA